MNCAELLLTWVALSQENEVIYQLRRNDNILSNWRPAVGKILPVMGYVSECSLTDLKLIEREAYLIKESLSCLKDLKHKEVQVVCKWVPCPF